MTSPRGSFFLVFMGEVHFCAFCKFFCARNMGKWAPVTLENKKRTLLLPQASVCSTVTDSPICGGGRDTEQKKKKGIPDFLPFYVRVCVWLLREFSLPPPSVHFWHMQLAPADNQSRHAKWGKNKKEGKTFRRTDTDFPPQKYTRIFVYTHVPNK